MKRVWAIALRRALAAGALTALLGCAPDQMPTPLLGTWHSDDARFQGRTLEIDLQAIRFMWGQQELDAILVRAVTQEGDGGGPIHFAIEGTDREGQDTTLSFEMHRLPTELLHLDTQREPWRRTPRAQASKPVLQPWGRKTSLPVSGGER